MRTGCPGFSLLENIVPPSRTQPERASRFSRCLESKVKTQAEAELLKGDCERDGVADGEAAGAAAGGHGNNSCGCRGRARRGSRATGAAASGAYAQRANEDDKDRAEETRMAISARCEEKQ